MTDEQLRELYARGLSRGGGAFATRGAQAERGGERRERCVTPEELLALVRREGPEERRLELLDHVMACGACRGEFDLLRAIEQAGAEATAADSVVAMPRIGRRGGWRWLTPMALAASVLLAVGIGIGLERGRLGNTGDRDVMRGGGGEVTALTPAGEVRASGPLTFAWRPAPGASRYYVEVLDGEGEAVYGAATTDTVLVMQEIGRLTPGVEYRWWVRASSDGGAQRRSALRRFRLAAE